MKVTANEVEVIVEFDNGDQQRYSKPAFAPSVKADEIVGGKITQTFLTVFPDILAVRSHFERFVGVAIN
jgi:hypothetical protein